jgi:predicted AlkP superfamily phosphohydrolase/phosphomutase
MCYRLVLLASALLFTACGGPRAPKLIIVGLDAFNWHVLAPLLQQGRMPVTEGLVRDGWWDVLLPEEGPIISPRLWTSIATGRTVHGHGIFDWQVYSKEHGRRGSGPSDRRCAAFWNVFSTHGLTVGVVDWMAAWPPEQVSGYMVSKLFYPPGGNTYPPDLEEELWALRGNVDYEHLIPNDREDGWATTRNELLLSVVSHLIRTRPVDVLAVMNYTPDPVQHKFWKYHEPWEFPHSAWWADSAEASRGMDRNERLAGVLEKHYVWSDTLLATCLSAADPTTTVLLVSDHGQGPCDAPLIRATKEGVNRLLAALGHASVDSTGRAIRRRSTAWAEGVVGGRVGLVVNPEAENLEASVDRVGAALAGTRFQGTREPAFSFVGPCADVGYDRLKRWAVDLCAVPAVDPDHYQNDAQLVAGDVVFPVRDLVKITTDNSGCHRSEGFVVLQGPGVRARGPVTVVPTVTGQTPKQVDVLPTVLYLLGLPLSRELEGRILWEALDPTLRADRPPTHIETYGFMPPTLPEETPDSRDITEKKLHALGYVQ